MSRDDKARTGERAGTEIGMAGTKADRHAGKRFSRSGLRAEPQTDEV